MIIDINKCDLTNDYFHFTNKKNIDSILNNGLIPSVGTASKLVGDEPNVSVSQGGKGIMGIIDSFIYKFSEELSLSQIPDEYKKYFSEITDFNSNNLPSKDNACKAMIRKLKDEVYFKVQLSKEQLGKAEIGGFTGFDVKLPMSIDSSKLDLITDSNNKVLTAYDVALHIYEKAKNIEVFREHHEKLFHMFEMENKNIGNKHIDDALDR